MRRSSGPSIALVSVPLPSLLDRRRDFLRGFFHSTSFLSDARSAATSVGLASAAGVQNERDNLFTKPIKPLKVL